MLTRFALFASVLTAALGVASAANATPALDDHFGGGGFLSPKVREDVPYRKRYQVPREFLPQADGKLVVPMSLDTRFGERWHRPVMRFNTDGTRDATWGTNGVAWVRVRGYRYVWLTGAINGPVGDIYAYGYFSRKRPVDAYASDGWFVTHIGPDGVQDPDFGIRGAIRIPRKYATVKNVALGSGGRIFATDATWIPPKAGHVAVRIRAFDSSGMLDRAYADRGVAKTEFRHGEPNLYKVRNGLLVTLQATWRVNRCIFKRYLLENDGRRDTGFGENGTVNLDLNEREPHSMVCSDFDLGRDGKLLTIGLGAGSPTGDAFAMRLDASGRPDPTFGTNGIWQPAKHVYGYRVVELPDGSAMFTGSDPEGGLVIGAITASGSTDTAFGAGGLLKYETTALLGPAAGPGSAYVALQADYGFKEEWSEFKVLRFSLPNA